jgi:uncharacterized protein DUF4410
MTKWLLLLISLAAAPVVLFAQGKPLLVVNVFTTAPNVALPYDMKQLQTSLVPEFKVLVGKQFDVVAEPPASPSGSVFTLDALITDWRAGNAAKRIVIGLGSGREATDIQFSVTDGSGKKLVESKDTVRTNFYSQSAGSTGTLAHPIAQKIADRIKDAKIK